MLQMLEDYLRAKNLKSHWISSRDIDDQRILQSDWMKGKAGHSNKSGSLMLHLLDDYPQAENLGDPLIPSIDIDDQRILQSDG